MGESDQRTTLGVECHASQCGRSSGRQCPSEVLSNLSFGAHGRHPEGKVEHIDVECKDAAGL